MHNWTKQRSNHIVIANIGKYTQRKPNSTATTFRKWNETQALVSELVGFDAEWHWIHVTEIWLVSFREPPVLYVCGKTRLP